MGIEDPESFWSWIWDPGWKNSDLGWTSWICSTGWDPLSIMGSNRIRILLQVLLMIENQEKIWIFFTAVLSTLFYLSRQRCHSFQYFWHCIEIFWFRIWIHLQWCRTDRIRIRNTAKCLSALWSVQFESFGNSLNYYSKLIIFWNYFNHFCLKLVTRQ
jgi:hypothetical protein